MCERFKPLVRLSLKRKGPLVPTSVERTVREMAKVRVLAALLLLCLLANNAFAQEEVAPGGELNSHDIFHTLFLSSFALL